MCIQHNELCPGCRYQTGRTYMYPIHHGITDEPCEEIIEDVFVPRNTLASFFCRNTACAFSRDSTELNERMIAAAKGQMRASITGQTSLAAAFENGKSNAADGVSPSTPQHAIAALSDITNRPNGITQSDRPILKAKGVADSCRKSDGDSSSGKLSSAAVLASDDEYSRNFYGAPRPVNSKAKFSVTTGKQLPFFRAKHRIRKEDLAQKVQDRIDELMKQINDHKIPAAHAINAGDLVKSKAPDLWLDAEDNLVQLLRLHRFPYQQMEDDFLVHRTRGAIEHRRMKQRKGQIGPPFVYVPDEEAVPETPIGYSSIVPKKEVEARDQQVEIHSLAPFRAGSKVVSPAASRVASPVTSPDVSLDASREFSQPASPADTISEPASEASSLASSPSAAPASAKSGDQALADAISVMISAGFVAAGGEAEPELNGQRSEDRETSPRSPKRQRQD